jgi:hypothetical protein
MSAANPDRRLCGKTIAMGDVRNRATELNNPHDWTYVRIVQVWERYRITPRDYPPTGRAGITERAPPACPAGLPLGQAAQSQLSVRRGRAHDQGPVGSLTADRPVDPPTLL